MAVEKNKNNPQKSVVLIDDKLLYREALSFLLKKNRIEVLTEFGFDYQPADMSFVRPPNLFIVSPNIDDRHNILQIEDIISKNPSIPVLLIVPPLSSHQALNIVRIGISGLILKTQGFCVLLKAIDRVISGELWFDRGLIHSVIGNIEKKVPNDPLNALSKKEREVAELVAHGLNTLAIANKLHISEKTVRNHLHSIYGKLDLKDRLTLANYARVNTITVN